MIEAIFGLIGVVVGSFLTIAKDSFAARRQRKKDGSYSAIRLICILHEYADHCVDVVCDDGTGHGQPAGRIESGVYYDPQVRQPEPPQYPDDIAWRSLPESLMHQIFGLPNKARATDRYIYGELEFAATPPDYPELFEARQEGYAKPGHDALSLAEQLSGEYRITATHKADLGFDWDAKAFLHDTIIKFEKRRKEQEARHSSVSVPATPPNPESKNNEE